MPCDVSMVFFSFRFCVVLFRVIVLSLMLNRISFDKVALPFARAFRCALQRNVSV